MIPSKFLVMTAIGIWLVTALVFAVVWDVQPEGLPFLFLLPFEMPAMIVEEHLDWSLPLGWSIANVCCTAAAWLVAAIELWRRPKTRLAWCVFAGWTAFVIIGYYSLHHSLRDC